MNRYYVIIKESSFGGYHYDLFDEYRGTLISGDYVSRDKDINRDPFLYKMEIDISLFYILKKDKPRFNDINWFITKYGLEEKIIWFSFELDFFLGWSI